MKNIQTLLLFVVTIIALTTMSCQNEAHFEDVTLVREYKGVEIDTWPHANIKCSGMYMTDSSDEVLMTISLPNGKVETIAHGFRHIKSGYELKAYTNSPNETSYLSSGRYTMKVTYIPEEYYEYHMPADSVSML